jgi:hypothetical protein
MPKGQQRGNREQKKPKMNKLTPAKPESAATTTKSKVTFGKRGLVAPKS